MDKKSLNEAEIRREYIDPVIMARWGSPHKVTVEYCFTAGRIVVNGNMTSRKDGKRADYLLSWMGNLPLAVVEAKDNNHPVGGGIQQAVDYAEILDVPFAYSSNGDAFIERDRYAGTEREIALEDFPGPEELWKRYCQQRQLSTEQEKIINQPCHWATGGKTPRYYQRVAINRAVDAVSKGQNRILLAMATGTGKTFTAFQIVWRLWKAGLKKRILFLADRDVLVSQAMKDDFKPFQKLMTRVNDKRLESAYPLQFSLYHQLAGTEGNEPFRQLPPDFFDLILIDECHRGSADEESSWRRILDYFSSAAHIGMTATPKETRQISTSDYFGKPLYAYSLKQGIEDGFLAPYKLKRYYLDRDVDGWRPEPGKLDKFGNPVEDRQYTLRDYDRKLVIDERTELVARLITEHLKQNDRLARTIVFCEDVEHADRMRRALVNLNSDLMAERPQGEQSDYIVRITHDERFKKKELDNFTSLKKRYPVIATTSDLLSTGVDCKDCKVIVLDKNISSDIELKQIVGRGTRLVPQKGKEFFTILDFRGITSKFAHDDFWVDPEQVEDFSPEKGGKNKEKPPTATRRDKTHVNGVQVKLLMETEQSYGKDGRPVTEKLTDYRRSILGRYGRLDDFLTAWNNGERRDAILQELAGRGVDLEEWRALGDNAKMDEFDLICNLAYDRPLLTRAQRASRVRAGKYVQKYKGLAREVLYALLDKYAQFGIGQLADGRVYDLPQFLAMGGKNKIAQAFGGRDKLFQAMEDLRAELYTAS